MAARLLRGAVGGILAGMVFAGVTMWFADSTGGKATMPLHMISTIVKGDKAMAAGTTSVGLGLLVHMVLSALFGMVFGTLLSFAFFGSGARRGEPVLAIHGARDTTGGAPGRMVNRPMSPAARVARAGPVSPPAPRPRPLARGRPP